MPSGRVWARLLGVERTTVERVEFDENAGLIVADVKPYRHQRYRCGKCQKRCSIYDSGEGRRRWRALDLGTIRCELEADAPRVRCAEHGVIVAAVPWARHHAGHTRFFDDQIAWLAVRTSKTAVCALMRIAWRTVGAILTRVCADVDRQTDRLDGLRRIGIDEISRKRGHKYLTVVVDHDTKRLVWACEGHGKAQLHAFFDALGAERADLLTHVSADGANWIKDVVNQRCGQVKFCLDAFHVVAWATDALDKVRGEVLREARALAREEAKIKRRPGQRGSKDQPARPARDRARKLHRVRYPLWKNPENLTERQQQKLEWIAKTDPRLYRAYLLKEGLREVFKLKGDAGIEALDRWISWAQRCRIPAFVDLQRRLRTYRPDIETALREDLSNALIESTNTKIRLLTRIAYGFHNANALIALAMLALGTHQPALPGRNP